MNKLRLVVFVVVLGICIIIPGGVIGIIILFKVDPVSSTFIKNKIPFLKAGIKKMEESYLYKRGTELLNN